MRCSILVAILLVLPLAPVTAGDFEDQKVSWRMSWGGGSAADRLAAVRSMGTFGTGESVRILLTAIPLVQAKIDVLLEERELLRSGRHPDVKSRNPAGYLREVKERLDAEYAILEEIEQSFGKLRRADAINYLARRALFREKFWKSRAIVARTLGLIGDRVLIDALGKALKDRDPRVRASVLNSLGATRAEEAIKPIAKALKDKDWMVRSAAVDALGKIRDPETFEALLAMMEREDGLLAEQCAEALENITGESFGRAAALWKTWWAENEEKVRAGMRGEKPKPRVKPKPDDRYYHAIPVKSKRTIFILDVSESMSYSNEEYQEKPKPGEESRLDLAKKELIATLKMYQRRGTFGLIAFHTVVKAWRPRIVPASKPMREDAVEWIEDLEPTGTTNVYGALEAAFRMAGMGIIDKYYPPAADTIFLLSDGAPTNRDLSEDDSERIFRAVRQWNRLGRMKIHTIGLKGHSQPFMERLARENGGTYVGRD